MCFVFVTLEVIFVALYILMTDGTFKDAGMGEWALIDSIGFMVDVAPAYGLTSSAAALPFEP